MTGVDVSIEELIALRPCARELNFSRHKRTKTHRAGGHLSMARGRGMDFEEVRVYQPGDDVRSMDWRVTARTNVPHIKVFREERERPVFLLVDGSESMNFGTRTAFKSVIAARAAAMLAWATVASGDRIGAVIESTVIKPGNRHKAVMRVLKALTDRPQPESFTNNLKRLHQIAPTGSLIFMLSDFENFDEKAEQLYRQLAQRHQLVLGMLYDPIEAEPPEPGFYQFTDGTENLLINTTSTKLCERYRNQFSDKITALKQLAREQGQSFFQLATNQPILPVLRDMLQHVGGTH